MGARPRASHRFSIVAVFPFLAPIHHRDWDQVSLRHYPHLVSMSPCRHCGASTVWDDDASSAICTVCGTLVDSSQSVLSSISDYQASWNPSFLPNPTLKSLRNPNWQLAGQGKEARDRQNSVSSTTTLSLFVILLLNLNDGV